MAVYEGKDNQGKLKRTFEIVSTLEAAQYFKASADKAAAARPRSAIGRERLSAEVHPENRNHGAFL